MKTEKEKDLSSDKLKALKLTIEKIDKDFGKGSVMMMNERAEQEMEIISTGSIGLDIALGKPVYVTAIEPETNTVVLGDEDDLQRSEMVVSKLNWIKYDGIEDGREALTKIRYKDKGAMSSLFNDGGNIRVSFYENVKGVAPGQSAVFYEGDDVIGGGIIQGQCINNH